MIITQNLIKRFADDAAIRYSDLSFISGKSYALLGASGCGKSTLLNMIAGILSPTEGTVEIDGQIITNQPQRERDAFRILNIGYVFQDFKLLEDMTVQENINILRLEGVNTSGMNELLEKLGILPLKKRRVRKLSGGEKQRVAIARALIKKPKIILADEPTGNLNFETGSAIVQQLLDNAGDGTLITVTHDERLAPMFDHVMNMDEIASAVTRREAAVHA